MNTGNATPHAKPVPARGKRAPSTSEADEGTMSDAQVGVLLAALPPLRDITADSRRVAPHVAFAAYPGTQRDGRASCG